MQTVFPKSDLVRIKTARIVGRTAMIEVRTSLPEIETPRLWVNLLDSERSVEMQRNAASGTLSAELPISDTEVVVQLALIFRSNGQDHRATEADDNVFSQKLLSRSLPDINCNIRWSGRISDLDTRYFAARNSALFLSEKLELRQRCLVSVGYTAIEQARLEILDWVGEEVEYFMSAAREMSDLDSLTSFVSFAMHFYVAKEDANGLQRLSLLTIDVLRDYQGFPFGAGGYLHVALFLGGLALASKNGPLATAIFAPTLDCFHIAILGYPRALINHWELVGVSRMNLHCQIGLNLAKGVPMPDYKVIQKLTPELAFAESHRLRDKEAEQRLHDKYLGLAEQGVLADMPLPRRTTDPARKVRIFLYRTGRQILRLKAGLQRRI